MKPHSLKRLVAEDIKTIRFYKNKKNNIIHTTICTLSPSFICTTLYRLSHALHLLKLPVLPRVIWWLNFLLFKVDIDQRCKLYGGIYLPHPMCIVIGEHVSLDGYAKIMQGVTIGGNLGKISCQGAQPQYQPKIEGEIFVGSNSIVVGPINISGKVFVSANSIVSEDFNNTIIYASNKCRELDIDHEAELYKA